MPLKKKTLVLGASDNPARYSYLAIQRLRSHGYPVVAVGRKDAQVGDVKIDTDKIAHEEVDTVTLYLSKEHQKEYYDYILALKPKRIIFNPGAENEELAEIASHENIQALDACTLVMVTTGQY